MDSNVTPIKPKMDKPQKVAAFRQLMTYLTEQGVTLINEGDQISETPEILIGVLSQAYIESMKTMRRNKAKAKADEDMKH